MFAKALFGPPKTHFWVKLPYLQKGPSTSLFLQFILCYFHFGLKSCQFMTFKSLFGQFTILSLSFVTFRVSRFHVSYLTHETFKLSLQNTLNMSKMTRVYFGVLQFSPPPPPPPPPPYKNFVLEIHTLACACSISDPFFSCLLQKLERDSHLSQQSSIRTTSHVLIFQNWIGTYSF